MTAEWCVPSPVLCSEDATSVIAEPSAKVVPAPNCGIVVVAPAAKSCTLADKLLDGPKSIESPS